MTKTALFLYGTLRAGEDLEHLLPHAKARYGATVRGRLHYCPHAMGYPVLLPGEDADRVTGEVVWHNLEHPDVAYTVLMELQAGYSATWCDVELSVGGVIRALTFTWHPSDGAGDRITGDDWKQRNVGRGIHRCFDCAEEYGSANEATECEWTHQQDDYERALGTETAK